MSKPNHDALHILCYIGLGSNLNHPLLQLQTALGFLEKIPNSRFIKVSSFYQTTPIGPANQDDFINAVACLETQLSSRALLENLQKIECMQGRVRTKEKNGPRTLDLDLLTYGNQVSTETDLVLPHPALEERAFVLVPLLEIAPQLILPNGKAAKDCLLRLEDTEKLVCRLS